MTVRLFVFAVALLFIPAIGSAQDATVNGAVTDSTGGVLPGVTVTALHTATGNTFTAVTDERGNYRIPLRVGMYRLTLELQGFGAAARQFEALVGQTLTIDVQLMPSTVQESVTVTGEAPLIETTSSTLAGNIDPRQTKDLPVNGGNWLDLSLLAPGNRSNGADPNTPTARNRFDFQLNIDGQQVTNNGRNNAANPRVSQEAIGEFQFIASRWDASQGRSNGVLVNAVTKSGTNTSTGSAAVSFRSSRFNARDFVQDRVLPYSNQRFNGTYGGPIRRDRAHYFVYYEREREPSTITFNSPYPAFNVDQERRVIDWNGGARLDFQIGAQQHLMLRGTKWIRTDPAYAGLNGATTHPSSQGYSSANSDTLFVTHSKVLGNRGLNEVKFGFSGAVERIAQALQVHQAGLAQPILVLRGRALGEAACVVQVV